jgi:hypothetical protein
MSSKKWLHVSYKITTLPNQNISPIGPISLIKNGRITNEICSKSPIAMKLTRFSSSICQFSRKKCFIGGVLKSFCDFKHIILKSPITLKLQGMCYMHGCSGSTNPYIFEKSLFAPADLEALSIFGTC